MAATELVVEVRGADREALAGAVVEFRSLGPTNSAFVYLNPPGAITRRVVTDTTDTRGIASTPVRLGYIAGTAHLLVTVQSAGFQDTVSYLIRPGAPAAIVISPADTAMYVGGSYPLTATATDQWGNRRPDAVTFGTATPHTLTVSGDRVSGKIIGRGIVTARTGNVVDSAYVSLVPQGTLVLRGAGIWMMNLDGSGLRAIPRTAPPSNWGVSRQPLDWSPSGAELAFFGDGGAQQLWAGTPDGVVRPLVPPARAGTIQRAPRFSRDGEWVYYNQGDPSRYSTSLWRVRVNGTGAERLTPDTPAFYTNDVDASGSPDGRKIVYGTDRERGWGISPPRRLVVMDLATRAVQDLGVLGNEPRWSPVSDRDRVRAQLPALADQRGRDRRTRPDTGSPPVPVQPELVARRPVDRGGAVRTVHRSYPRGKRDHPAAPVHGLLHRSRLAPRQLIGLTTSSARAPAVRLR